MPIFISITPEPDVKDIRVRRWITPDKVDKLLHPGMKIKKTHEGVAEVALASTKEIEEFRMHPPARLKCVRGSSPIGGNAA